MFQTNKDGYLEYTPDENEEEKATVEKHYYHYIPYPIYVHDYPWSPHMRWPYYPQYPTGKPMWVVTPETYTWSTTSGGTNGYKN